MDVHPLRHNLLLKISPLQQLELLLLQLQFSIVIPPPFHSQLQVVGLILGPTELPLLVQVTC